MSATPMVADAGVFTAARRMGRFHLLRELGRGAQATVWLAHDPRLDREVALKLFHAAADDTSVSHWLHEAHAVSRLTHPNIVPVFEAGAPPQPPYLVFEYVAGPTLAEARRLRRQWPAQEAVTLMLDVLAALAAAHAQGIVHRDFKPSNVLLGADGRARVMDFGIAARVAPSPGRAGALSAGSADRGHQVVDMTAGRIVGTPGVMLASDAGAQAEALAAAAPRLAERLGCSADDVVAATHGARVRLRQLVEAMGLRVSETVATQRLLGLAPASRCREAVTLSVTATQVLPGRDGDVPPGCDEDTPTLRGGDAPPTRAGTTPSAHVRLEHGLGEVRRAHAAKTLSRNELLQLVLETMRRALDLRCAVVCLREAGSGSITGRFGVGAGAGEARAAFRIATDGAAATDLFAALCAKGADVLVADAARFTARLPAWYRQRVNAPTFLLLPMMDQGAAVGLIYGDKAVAGTLVLSDAELGLVRALRGHALDACRAKR